MGGADPRDAGGGAGGGPLFSLIRAGASCGWAVRWDVGRHVTDGVNGLTGEEPPVADFRQGPVHAQRSVDGTSASLQGSAIGPGSLAAGVVQGVVGRGTTELRQGVEEAAFRRGLCIVGTLGVERVGCRGGFVGRPSAQIHLPAERGGRTGGFDAGGQAAVSQRARIGTAKSPSPKLVQTSPS